MSNDILKTLKSTLRQVESCLIDSMPEFSRTDQGRLYEKLTYAKDLVDAMIEENDAFPLYVEEFSKEK